MLSKEKYTVLYRQTIDGKVLLVKETDKYRWFEYAGNSIQSVMNKLNPAQIVSPVCQSFLLFVLHQDKPINVLNLGFGGGAFERTLYTLPNIALTSVESSSSIIDMSDKYFNLPANVDVICQKAELYIVQSQTIYDVILCDLFIGEKNPDFIFSRGFYKQLAKITTKSSVIMVSIQANSEERLFTALTAIKKYFPFIALIEFDNYSNIVVMAGKNRLNSKESLQNSLLKYEYIDFDDLQKSIENMHYIP